MNCDYHSDYMHCRAIGCEPVDDEFRATNVQANVFAWAIGGVVVLLFAVVTVWAVVA